MRDIKQLTAVRGLFALYVAIYHIFPRNTSFVANGYLSVDLFFILSGFVMSYVYYEKFKWEVSFLAYVNFLKARVARVYPLYVFVIVAISALYYVNKIQLPSLRDYSYLFLFFQSVAVVQENIVPHAWSIAVEILAYLILPFALKSLLGRKIIPLIMVGICLSFAGLALVATYGSPNGPMDVITGFPAIARCFCSYFLGMLGYLIASQYKNILTEFNNEILLLVSCIIGLLALNHRGFDLVAIASFAIIVPTLSESNGIISRVLSLKLFVYLGEISYSIYLVHYPLCRSLSFIPSWIHERINIIDANWISLILTIMISMLTYRLIEIPCRNIIKVIRIKPISQL